MPRSCALIVTALLGPALAACGGPEDSDAPATQVQSPRGLHLELATDAPFTRAADFDARMESTIEVALQYWGGSWALLEDRTIHLVDTPTVDCGGRESLGCYDGHAIWFTTRDPGTGTVACIEQTVLVHEIGHLVLGDADHHDPRWMELAPVAAALSGRVGYQDGGTVPCDTYPSVWRHPLGTP